MHLLGGAQGVICVHRLWDEFLTRYAQKRSNTSDAYVMFHVLHRKSINIHGFAAT